jgi:two-component system sensor histidine kinase GlrK
MHRYSFRQLLLVAFMLIAALLSAASLRGLYSLEILLRQSSEGASRAVAHTADAQVLAERTVAMERAARQYLVLDDPVLRQRFEEATRDANAALARLADNRIPSSLATEWRNTRGPAA